MQSDRLEWKEAPDDSLRFRAPEAGQYVILDNGDAWVDVVVLSPPDYRREGVPVSERWLLVKQDGEWRLDRAAQDLPLP